MITVEEAEMLREDAKLEHYRDEQHERLMRTDTDYWIDNSDFNEIVEAVRKFRKQCELYDRNFDDELNAVKDCL